MKYHQGIRAEIETRSKNFKACLELGESLLQREHQASEEVRGPVGQRWPPPVLAPTPAGPDSFLGGFFGGGASFSPLGSTLHTHSRGCLLAGTAG